MKLRSFVLALSALSLAFSACAQSKPACHPIVGEMHVEHFVSKVFPYPQTLRVWLPPGYHDSANAQRHYPVLYMFDGQNVFDDCTAEGHVGWKIDQSMTKLIGEVKVQPLIVVGIDTPNNDDQRASELLPVEDPIVPSKLAVHGDRLPQFMGDEVMPLVEREFRVQQGRAATAVGGSSYGGVAALYLLINMPNEIGVGLIESPSASPGNGAIARWTEYLDVPPLRVSIGVGDIESMRIRKWVMQMGQNPDQIDRGFVRVARAVADNLRAAAGPDGEDSAVRFNEDPKGTHSEDVWARRFPAAIEFLFPAKGKSVK